MKANNVNRFLGLAALWLVLASSSLGAPHTNTMDQLDGRELLQYLEDMEAFYCNVTYFRTADKEDPSKNCFINELDNIEKNCSTKEHKSVPDIVYLVRTLAEHLFQPNGDTNGSCDGYEQKDISGYVEDFKSWVKRINAMNS